MIELIGLIGATAFALSGVPQAIKSWKEGHSRGVAHGTVLLWMSGELAMFVYAFAKYPSDFVLLGNYLANLLVVGVIAWFKYRPTRGASEILIVEQPERGCACEASTPHQCPVRTATLHPPPERQLW